MQRLAPSHDDELELGWLGPSLEQGPLPALFYFALSLEDTLLTDPYNQPIQKLLEKETIRIFSATLPFHRYGQNEQKTANFWIDSCLNEPLFFERFFQKLAISCRKLEAYITNLGFCGLSRGAFIAAHLSHHLRKIKAFEPKLDTAPIALLAPLCTLSVLSDSEGGREDSLLKRWDLKRLPLATHPLFISIGHQDTRVCTEHAFELMQTLCEAPTLPRGQHELVIYPSIGYKGHGTPDAIFESASLWILQHLLS